MPVKKTYFNWSSGKDSALALWHLLQDKDFQVGHLLTSVNAHHNRVSMHGLRRELLEEQIQSIGIPFSTVELPEQPGMAEYEILMKDAVERLQQQGFNHTAFGDIFLEDLRAYREKQLEPFGITTHFPLWKQNTRHLIGDFLELGFKAIVICVKAELLDRSFVGRVLDKDFLSDLPVNIDPCGENGEFHTFCYDGPIFSNPVGFTLGDKIYRQYQAPENKDDNCFAPNQDTQMGFWFSDLLPVNGG